jgi:hypothetical protein
MGTPYMIRMCRMTMKHNHTGSTYFTSLYYNEKWAGVPQNAKLALFEVLPVIFRLNSEK